MNKIVYKHFDIELIHNKKLKNTYISIGLNSKIIIKSSHKSNKFILALIKEKEIWIEKQIIKIESCKVYDFNIEDEVFIFGQLYSMDAPESKILRDKLHKLKVLNPQKVLKCYDYFYKHISKDYMTRRVEHYSKSMNLKYEAIKYRKMRSRWGSCSSKKIITLNSELIKIEKDLIDYVIVHELAHLVHMNHSFDFHNLVKEFLPNSKFLRKRLKEIRLFF